MSDRPWHKRYHSDALTGFQGLTLEERGAYQTLLDLMYDRQEPLIDDTDDRMRLIAGYLGVGLRKYRSVTASLLQKGKIFRRSDGRLSNKRFEKETKNKTKTSEKRAESGKLGGEKKAENRKKTNENNDELYQELEQNSSLYQRPEVRSQRLESKTTDSAASSPRDESAAAARDATEIGKRCLNAMGIDHRDPTWAGNYSWVMQWLANGFDVERDIIPTIQRVMARRNEREQGLPGSLNFFTKAIAEAYRSRLEGAANVVQLRADVPTEPPTICRDYEWPRLSKQFPDAAERVVIDGYSIQRDDALKRLTRWFVDKARRPGSAQFRGYHRDRLDYPPGDRDAVWPADLVDEAKHLAEAETHQPQTTAG